MKTLADLYKTTNLAQIVAEQNRLPTSISKMIQTSGIQKQLKILDRYNFGSIITPDVLKTINQSNNHLKMFASGQQSIFPETTLSKIASIVSNQHKLVNSLNNIDWLALQPAYKNQIPNFNFALSGISTQLARIAVETKKWDILEDFEQISANALAINVDVIENEGITNENFNELKNLIDRIEIKIDHQNNNVLEILLKYITIIGFILTMIAESRNWIPKPEYATKEEVTDVIKTQIQNIETKLKEHGDNRFTKVKCKVMLRPRKKSLIISNLPPEYDLIVHNTFHKWAYISYLNPKDGLPESGWVMKKYLLKKK